MLHHKKVLLFFCLFASAAVLGKQLVRVAEAASTMLGLADDQESGKRRITREHWTRPLGHHALDASSSGQLPAKSGGLNRSNE
jgi:hypothetical protein